jgi:hypothetical protein
MPTYGDYKSKQFACATKGCKGVLIPVKVIDSKKAGGVDVIGTCPTCQKHYEFKLPSQKAELAQWGPIIKERMFRCTYCGSPRMRVDSREGSAKTFYKFEVSCLACRKTGERILDGYMFNLVSDVLLAMAQTTTASTQQTPPVRVGVCPTCGYKIPAEMPTRFCNNCGQELACSTCGTPQPAGATTCKKCGSPVRPGRKMSAK